MGGDAVDSRRQREELVKKVDEVGEQLGVTETCAAIGLSRATYYRRRGGRKPSPRRRTPPPRKLPPSEREKVLETLHEPRFMDLAPAQVFAQLLDEQTYLCSIRTMHRILEENVESRERRNQLRRPSYEKPQLMATKPNELWSWDITKLLGPQKWTYYYLYVLLDVFSRYVVGWLIAERESGSLGAQLVSESCERQGIKPGQLNVHSDRGGPMTSKTLAQKYADLGVTKTHSRPYTSDDNPFSESQFKTLKYRPEFPDRFGSIEHARDCVGDLLDWYNFEHRHSSLAMLTPHDVHCGLADQRLAERAAALEAAYRAHPERFVHGMPKPQMLARAVWINPPDDAAKSTPHGTRAGTEDPGTFAPSTAWRSDGSADLYPSRDCPKPTSQDQGHATVDINSDSLCPPGDKPWDVGKSPMPNSRAPFAALH